MENIEGLSLGCLTLLPLTPPTEKNLFLDCFITIIVELGVTTASFDRALRHGFERSSRNPKECQNDAIRNFPNNMNSCCTAESGHGAVFLRNDAAAIRYELERVFCVDRLDLLSRKLFYLFL